MAPFRNLIYAIGALSAIPSVVSSPILVDVCLPLGLIFGDILELFDPPDLTEVVPFFALSTTTVTSAGVYTVGTGCSAETITAQCPTELTVTKVATKTTTYPCPTSTSFTSTWWDPCKGHSTTATCRWTPPATPPASTKTVTATVTDTITCTVTDTATSCSSTPTPPPLSCDPHGYLVQFATFYRVDITTGTTTKIASGLGDNSSINSIGYNVNDNLIYGSQGSTQTIIRIAADGSSSTVAGAVAPASNLGDIDSNGQYWVSNGGNTWAQIDLLPDSATYGQTIGSGTAKPFDLAVADWVYIPSAGEYLYSVGTNSTSNGVSLIRFNLDTKAWERVANYPTLKGHSTWGAQYGMNNGTVWASDNASGQIWQFPISGATPFEVSQGPAAGNNDGARCVLNLLN
jgi:hypothetical protein